VSAALSPDTVRVMARVAIESGRRVRFAIRGRSMSPLVREPMVLEVAPLQGRARIGDILVFAWGDNQVAHRVVGYAAENYVTCGDAQPGATEIVAPSLVVGRVHSIWKNGSAPARRVDGTCRRLCGLLYAHGYPIRRRAARSAAIARAARRYVLTFARRLVTHP
jgi:hypothetical protein